MNHLVLLGDSVFDNAPYVRAGEDVSSRLATRLPAEWQLDLLAADGSTTSDVLSQIQDIPATASHLFLSVGGNDALLKFDVLMAPVELSGQAFQLLHAATLQFERSYRQVLDLCAARHLPLTVCTIYGGDFEDEQERQAVKVGLMAFNDVIIRAASRVGADILDMRQVCSEPEDFTRTIEPSARGAEKIALALSSVVTGAQDTCHARTRIWA